MDGPRALRPEEFPSLARLLNRTFRSKSSGDMVAEYPQLMEEVNHRRLTVISEGGEIVTHIGISLRQLSFEGLPLGVALVGGVATAEHCRGRGYATRCLDVALDGAAAEGADLAWISGGRGLYTSRGSARVGREWVFHIPSGPEPAGTAVREFSADGFDAAAELYRQEPVRFLRTRDDWTRAARNRFVMNGKSKFWSVFKADRLCAYLILHESPDKNGDGVLAEFAGDRADAASWVPGLAARMRLAGVNAHVGDWDAPGIAAFRPAAASAKLENGRGTFLPLRMAVCMEKLRPRIAERCGEALAADLRFSESGEGPGSRSGAGARLHISLGSDEARIPGRAEVARFLLGGPDATPPAFEGAASVLEAIRPALPLPTPWYGVNYV